MVADANIVEAEVAQDILSLLNHAELLRGNGFAIGHPRAEAGHLGFVGGGQAELSGERADIGLGQASLLERGAHLELCGRLGAWAKVANIAGVFAVGDDRQAWASANGASSVNSSCLQK